MKEEQVETNEPSALNQAQDNEEIRNPQNRIVVVSLKVVLLLIFIPRLISAIFFMMFDTQCIVFDHASVLNCSQDFFVSNPTRWICAWFLLSIFSSLLYIAIIYKCRTKLNYKTNRAKQIWQKGSFFSLIFLLIVSLFFYSFRIFASGSGTIFLISILILLWSPVTVLLICVLNYLPQIQWQTVDATRYTLEWWKTCVFKNSNFFIYWLALLIHFVEITCKAIAVMLDVAHEVAPLIEHRFPHESSKYAGLMAILFGIRLAFHSRLLSFIWQKLFHGNKDLFSEPNIKLVLTDEEEPQPCTQPRDDSREENIELT